MKPKILFVCVENANRSQMAEAFAKHYGANRVEAYSAGSKPSGTVNPRAIEFMKEIDIDISGANSFGFDDLPIRNFDWVITMGCGDNCPFVPADKHISWDIPDPKHLPPDEFRAIRDIISNKVKELIQSLNND